MEFQKIENSKAISLWNELQFQHPIVPSIAHNPRLFDFFTGYLKLTSFYFILYHASKPAGLLPMVNTGKKFISMPHFSYGGIHWLEDEFKMDEAKMICGITDQIISEKLHHGFYRIDISGTDIQEPSVSSPIEIRSFFPFFNISEANKVVHLMPLKETMPEQQVTFSSNLRRKINKASKNNLKIESGKEELLDDFSKVYNANMHRIGSPTLGSKFFRALLQTPDLSAKIFVVYDNGKPIGSSFVMWYDGYYENTWFSTWADYNQLYPSYLLHSEMIKDAIKQKAKIYSMGRSTKNSGVHNYKKQWPVEERELYFSTNVKAGISLKDQKWLTKIWKRLPSAIVNSIGPFIAKKIY